MKNSNTTLLIVIGAVILLAVLGAGFYFSQQSSSQTAMNTSPSPSAMTSPVITPSPVSSPAPIPDSWVESSDTVTGVKIAHPADWQFTPATTFGGETRITSYQSGEIEEAGPVPQDELKVALVRFPPNSTVNVNQPPADEIEASTQISVAGQPATRQVLSDESRNVAITFTYQDSRYLITAYPANSQYSQQLEQMVSSIQFVPTVNLSQPQPNQTVTSPIELQGQAPGNWFFEGQLSVQLVDKNGKVLGSSEITTQDNWMTQEAVSFSGKLDFKNPNQVKTADVVMNKSNPSGLPENDRQVRLPVQLQ